MLLNSFIFWIYFIVIFVVYWSIPKRFHALRKWLLIIVSYALYMSWKPVFALVLLGVTFAAYIGALCIDKYSGKQRKIFAWVASLVMLSPLLLFKYANFFNASISTLLAKIHLAVELPGLNWAIPIGISFFTFQALGYFFDVYRHKERPERSLPDFLLFCSFFPQTASGPISTASELLPKIKSEKSFVFANGVAGLKYVLWGVVLKCVVADRLGLYVDTVYGNYTHFSGVNCFLASIFFTIQIYSDFAGYSLMAIGVAKTLGFDLVNNFNRPYFADSVTSFWRRWHISLTRWLTTHVYIPLGGSRCSKPRQYANIMVTFIVSGLWHGANFTFIVWGGIHGLAQIAEKASGLDPKGKLSRHPWVLKAKPLRIVITFLIVSFAWIFFRMPTFSDAFAFIGRIFTDHTSQPLMHTATATDKLLTFFAIVLLFVADLRAEYLREHTRWLDSSWARWMVYVALFCAVLCIGVLDAGSFIYVNF